MKVKIKKAHFRDLALKYRETFRRQTEDTSTFYRGVRYGMRLATLALTRWNIGTEYENDFFVLDEKDKVIYEEI